MEKITELLNNFSLEKYIPKLDTLMGWVQWLVSLAVRIGPVCILVLGLIYLLCPPKEANRKAGFRTYFGMGSVMAWQFTQRIAGIVMIPVGLILTIIAFITVGRFSDMDLMTMASTAFSAIRGQAICALIVYVVLFVLTAVLFDRNGECRFDGPVLEFVNKLLPKGVENVPAQTQEEIPDQAPVQDTAETAYESETNHPITADDIVIEDIDDL